MDKYQVKGKVGCAVGRPNVKEWTDETKAQVEDAAHKVKGKAEHAWDKMKHAVQDAKDKVADRRGQG